MANPPMFLCMPFFFFFVRNTLTGKSHLSRVDIIHFLPAFIHIVDLTPVFFMPYEDKYKLAALIAEDPRRLETAAQGFIPGRWINVSRMILQVFYYCWSIQLLFRTAVKETWGSEAISIRNWLSVSVILVGLMLFSHSFYFIKELIYLEGGRVTVIVEYLSYFFFIVSFILLNIYIRINQHLVYGYTLQKIIRDTLKQSQQSTNNEISNKTLFDKSLANINLEKLDKKLEDLMKVHKIYLNKDLVFKDVAVKVGISDRLLSQYIRVKYHMGVREYINQFRILDAIELMKSGYLEEKSLEGLCSSVGFNSRVTFFLAFKKLTGMSPTEFLKHLGT
jgi:AraC-like DNA-binding protein